MLVVQLTVGKYQVHIPSLEPFGVHTLSSYVHVSLGYSHSKVIIVMALIGMNALKPELSRAHTVQPALQLAAQRWEVQQDACAY